MSFCGRNHGRNRSKPEPGCHRCRAKLEMYERLAQPATAIDTEDVDKHLESEKREKLFKENAGSLGICGSTGTPDDTNPSFENAVRRLEDNNPLQ
jgi:hypothetical protein